MPVGISNLAHSVRENTSIDPLPVSLGHAHQLVAAAMGYKSFASYQAAQAAHGEPPTLDLVRHVVLDHDMLGARAQELGLALEAIRLHELLNAALAERLPRARVHNSYGDLEDCLREQVQQAAIEDDEVNSQMANANYDGIDEVYFDFEVNFDGATIEDPLVVELDGHVGLGIDTERPFAGNTVNVEGTLALERLGRRCFAATQVDVTKAALDHGWSEPDADESEDGPPARSLTQAYAELLGLEPHEVGELVDVEPQALDGSSGEMVYSYLLDFKDHASPEVVAKILARHGSLQIEVGPGFFEGVRSDDWPR